MILENEINSLDLADVTVITLGEETKKHGMTLANFLRKGGLKVEIDYKNHNLKPQFKLADRVRSPYIVIIGEEEVNNNIVKVKDTINKTELILEIEKLNEYFKLNGEELYAYKK